MGTETTLAVLLATLCLASPAFADDAGYTYPGRTDNEFKSATITMTSATVPRQMGHVAVWLGAQDYIGHWLQAGIIEGHGQSFPCVYVETKVPSMPFVRQCIRFLEYGRPTKVQLTVVGRKWTVFVDGNRIASMVMDQWSWYCATAERYLGGSVGFTITP